MAPTTAPRSFTLNSEGNLEGFTPSLEGILNGTSKRPSLDAMNVFALSTFLLPQPFFFHAFASLPGGGYPPLYPKVSKNPNAFFIPFVFIRFHTLLCNGATTTSFPSITSALFPIQWRGEGYGFFQIRAKPEHQRTRRQIRN